MEICYIKSNRRTLALEITSDLRVLVRMPHTCSMARAKRFVSEHRDWIEKHYQRQKFQTERYALSSEQAEALRKEAKEYIPKRVKYFADLTGLVPAGISITSAKTRFGSCSAKNRLNFSLYLMLYSKKAVDYVVLHEICHIAYKNHGGEFYGLIARYMPDYKEVVKELKK